MADSETVTIEQDLTVFHIVTFVILLIIGFGIHSATVLITKRRLVANYSQIPREIPTTDIQDEKTKNLLQKDIQMPTKFKNFGWSHPDSQYGDNFHFRTAIASSYEMLECVITSKHPSLKRKPHETMRHYLQNTLITVSEIYSQEENDKLQDICQRYLITFEKARYGNVEFNYDEYQEFCRNVFSAFCDFFKFDVEEYSSSIVFDGEDMN
eukprot:TRINITY_DN20536_c5_g1_i1.p1 TRINITY_DN20536_c5_g1~~TRINITY_DN20536_c5_g1_i1.p1  ORF type:complete len:210 (-),score=23.44 TRINITY_DN20536_c5_g1_i1:92-721(-)